MADKMVKIGCRLPSGVRLRVSEWTKDPVGDPFLREIDTIDLAGPDAHVASPSLLHDEDGAAYTEVKADLWDKWLEMNKDTDLVTSGAVFKGKASAKTEEAKAAESPETAAPATAPGLASAPAGANVVADAENPEAPVTDAPARRGRPSSR